MAKLKMFCITMSPEHGELIKEVNYEPVGLGEKKFPKYFYTDRTGESISSKNPFYGEYTFHYWLWKNQIKNLDDSWIGFCQYRKFWAFDEIFYKKINYQELKNIILNDIPENLDSYESILGEPLFVNQFRLSKFIKNNFITMLKRPILFLDKRKRNIKFHFDMMHGKGNLDKAISLLDESERDDFNTFVENSVSFNPHNMFICKSKKTLEQYYNSIFPWLTRCEKIFGFELDGYGLKRIYGFLAERYMSYWFKKYTKFKIMPIIFKDLSDFKN